MKELIVLICILLILFAIFMLIKTICNAIKGKCCEGCKSCNLKGQCSVARSEEKDS